MDPLFHGSSLLFCVKACGSTVDAINGGNLTSPNYPGNYPTDLNCAITFRVTPGSVMLLVFREFDLDLGTGSCDKDFIRVSLK